MLARRKHGDEAVNKLYHEFGTAKHEEKKDLSEDTVRLCIEKAGFSPSLLDEALADRPTKTEYKDEHAAINKKGCFGVASLVINGSEPVFGPVIIPVPTGEEAGELLGPRRRDEHQEVLLRAEAHALASEGSGSGYGFGRRGFRSETPSFCPRHSGTSAKSYKPRATGAFAVIVISSLKSLSSASPGTADAGMPLVIYRSCLS